MKANLSLVIVTIAALAVGPGCQGKSDIGNQSKGSNSVTHSNDEHSSASSSGKSTQEIVDSQRWYDPNKKLNHLVGESSPYLLSHADNPVDWYPWGEEALARAKAEDKPIFLSVGYASCHWCHVMEHESFEDDSVAALLNEHFIAIKVDREQRPDIDQIYMTAVQTFTRGGGGWPMSVFMTSELKPFFAGTYFPRDDKSGYNRPGFISLLNQIIAVYTTDRVNINKQAEKLTEQLRANLAPITQSNGLSATIFASAITQSMGRVDFVYGGFGQSRKFPHTAELRGILRNYALSGDAQSKKALEITLRGLLYYGMYDQVGGGFHRYTVDRQWAVPHFEKMLYDNSLMVPLLLDAYLVFDNQDYLDGAIQTLDFLLREMRDTAGGFYSALDADSEGEEGLFYVFTKKEMDEILGSDSSFYYQYYVVTDNGNFEHKTNVMARQADIWAELKNSSDEPQVRAKLDALNLRILAERANRIRPLTDDKVVTAWNGMALSAFSRGYQVTGQKRFLDAAQKLGAFLNERMFQDGELLHTYRNDVTSRGPLLEDYGYVAEGMVDLYETDGNYRWLVFAHTLVNDGFTKFSDENGFLYLSVGNASDLIVRPSDIYDGSYPSPGSYLLSAAQRVAALTDDKALATSMRKSLATLGSATERSAAGMMSTVLVHHNNALQRSEFAIVGDADSRKEFLDIVYQHYLPYRIIAASDGADDRVALLIQRNPLNKNRATGFVCQDYVCQLPTENVAEFAALVKKLQVINGE
ncbi:thioredoxin domain-containing protein [bacterium AH-315-F03]|nr:thioredoxin domain-containing protein [bacterium AH-315-F03]